MRISFLILAVMLLAHDEPRPYMPPDGGVGSYHYDQEGVTKTCCDHPYHWPRREGRRRGQKKN